MPIRIEKYIGDEAEEIAWLCDDDWELPSQAAELQNWVLTSNSELEPGEYVIDIGFSPRESAAGGAIVFGNDILNILGRLGMSLLLSEYPAFVERYSANET